VHAVLNKLLLSFTATVGDQFQTAIRTYTHSHNRQQPFFSIDDDRQRFPNWRHSRRSCLL